VDRVSVYREAVDFFVVIEDAVTPEWATPDNMSVGENVSKPQERLESAMQVQNHPCASHLAGVTYPLSASTTNPVASLVMAGSVSNE
jgi:hypothetical protein